MRTRDKEGERKAIEIFYCGREKCAPGHCWGPAVRPHYLLHVILGGKGTYTVEKKTYALGAGDAFLIRPMVSHIYRADEQQPWEYAWVGFGGSVMEQVLRDTIFAHGDVFISSNSGAGETKGADSVKWEEMGGQGMKRRMGDPGGLMEELGRIHQERGDNTLLTGGLLLQLLGNMTVPDRKDSLRKGNEYVEKAMRYAEDNYGYDIGVQDIADWVGIDRTYLYKIFVQETGLSPKAYLTGLRLRHAAKMLQTTDYSITEISYSCGFCDPVSFHSYFRKQTGMTPGEFRKKERQNRKT